MSHPYLQQPVPGPPDHLVGGMASRRNVGLVVVAAILAVFMLAGCGLLAVFLLWRPGSGDGGGTAPPAAIESGNANDPERAKAVAIAYLDAVNARDATAARDATCKRTDPGDVYRAFEKEQGAKLFLVEVQLIRPGDAMVTYGIEDIGTTAFLFASMVGQEWCITY